MIYEKHFKGLFESINDYRKVVLLVFVIKDDQKLLEEIGFGKSDFDQLSLEFKFILMEQKEDYLDCVKNEEESIIEKILNKRLE